MRAVAVKLTVELEHETEGRWIAEVAADSGDVVFDIVA